VRRARLITAAAAMGIAAVLGAGYAAAGTTGLVDAAAVAAAGVLLVARGALRGETPRTVRPGKIRTDRARPVSAAEFAAYQRIASDLEWAQMSRRHYDNVLRPMLARLAAALDRSAAALDRSAAALDRSAALLDRSAAAAAVLPARPPAARDDADRPGPDLGTLDRIVTALERGAPGQGEP
jgi:hypothetical protein